MPRVSDPLDRIIGTRIHQQRLAKGMSQAALGKAIGVAGQQVQKYECALDRVPASRLWRIAVALGVPVGLFYARDGVGRASRRMLEFWRRRRERRDTAIRHLQE